MKVISAAELAGHFNNAWVFNYGPREELIAYNSSFFTSKLFIEVCNLMLIKDNFKTTYYPKTNGPVEQYKRIILAALRTYVVEHPRDWDLYPETLTYVYSFQPHLTTRVAPFELVLPKQPEPFISKPTPSVEEPEGNFTRYWKHWWHGDIKKTKKWLDKA